MKKTLTLACAALAAFSVATADDSTLTATSVTPNVTLTSQGIAGTGGDYAKFTGFTTTLNSTAFTKTDADDATNTTVTLAPYVTVDSISIAERVNTAEHASAPVSGTLVKIAVYTAAGTNGNQLGNLVGLSDSAAYTYGNGGTMTFTFDGLELATANKYWYMFVNGTTTVDGQTVEVTKDMLSADGYVAYKTARTFGAHVGNKADTSVLTTTALTTDAGTLSVASHFPEMTVKTSPIPEPATAALSLLALAGLASRRRRK